MGWLSWRTRRRKEHRPEILDLIRVDLKSQAPDHIAITGDLTHLGLELELAEASGQLRALGEPDTVHLVPGNHDAYRTRPGGAAWHAWEAYLSGDSARPGFPEFPTVRIRDEVALIGLSTAHPTPWPLATGWLGEDQLTRLSSVLRELGKRSLCRVLLLHHPPLEQLASRRRGLTDAAALQSLLAREGADLVLHGHVHRTCFGTLPGPTASIPSVGVRSGSARGRKPGRRAQYHLFRIGRSGKGFTIRVEVRGLVPDADRVERLEERQL